MTATTNHEQQSIRADAEHRLDELQRQHARFANAARYDPDVAAELEDVSSEIASCKRVIARFCSECGHMLLVAGGAERCCSSPCTRYGK
jgi:hypothetical protein